MSRTQDTSPTLVEVPKQTLRQHWTRVTDAVTGGQHAVVTYTRSRLTDDPNREPIAVAVPAAWWQEHLDNTQSDPDSIETNALAVHEFRPDMRTQLAHVSDDGWHLHVTWFGKPAIVFLPVEDYVRWSCRKRTQLVAEAHALAE